MEKTFKDKLAEAVTMIEKKGLAYAKARAISWQLQELRKVVLAEETRKAEGTSISEREAIARSSEIYRQHLEGTKEAIHDELKLKAECERWRATWESIRSLLSLEKKTMEVFKEE